MKINKTRWSPDTCGCILIYEWDGDNPNHQHTFVEAEHLCAAHNGYSPSIAYDKVKDENRRKNRAYAIAKGVAGINLDDFTFSFDNNRKLKVGFLGKLNASQRAELQTQLDAEFGASKAEVV